MSSSCSPNSRLTQQQRWVTSFSWTLFLLRKPHRFCKHPCISAAPSGPAMRWHRWEISTARKSIQRGLPPADEMFYYSQCRISVLPLNSSKILHLPFINKHWRIMSKSTTKNLKNCFLFNSGQCDPLVIGSLRTGSKIKWEQIQSVINKKKRLTSISRGQTCWNTLLNTHTFWVWK